MGSLYRDWPLKELKKKVRRYFLEQNNVGWCNHRSSPLKKAEECKALSFWKKKKKKKNERKEKKKEESPFKFSLIPGKKAWDCFLLPWAGQCNWCRQGEKLNQFLNLRSCCQRLVQGAFAGISSFLDSCLYLCHAVAPVLFEVSWGYLWDNLTTEALWASVTPSVQWYWWYWGWGAQ